jgi:hypothetical protein
MPQKSQLPDKLKKMLSLRVDSQAEAMVLVNALIELERSLREKAYLTGNIRLADKIHVARRALQEQAGLVLTLDQVKDMVGGEQ